MNSFIKIKNNDDDSLILNLKHVITIYPSYEYIHPNKIDDENNKLFFVAFIITDSKNGVVKKYCKSELEALMIYAKLEKLLCNNDINNELEDIL